MHFPSLVGGLSLRQHDLVPSIIFASLYGAVLLPLFIYRLSCKRSRTTVLGEATGLVVERIIMFCLRAVIANPITKPVEEQLGAMEYIQSTMALGSLANTVALAHMLRCLLVNSTYPSNEVNPSLSDPIFDQKVSWSGTYNIPLVEKGDSSFSSASSQMETCPDQPRRRFWFRRMHDVGFATYQVAFVIGSLGNIMLIPQRRRPASNLRNQVLRYVSSTLGVLFALSVCGVATWAGRTIPRVNHRATTFLVVLSLILVIPNIYRLTVMYRSTTTYNSYEPGAYNTTSAKVAFYLLHILPEWTVSFILGITNVRQLFDTGPCGDRRWRDETPEEKEKREKKEREKREKNGKLQKEKPEEANRVTRKRWPNFMSKS